MFYGFQHWNGFQRLFYLLLLLFRLCDGFKIMLLYAALSNSTEVRLSNAIFLHSYQMCLRIPRLICTTYSSRAYDSLTSCSSFLRKCKTLLWAWYLDVPKWWGYIFCLHSYDNNCIGNDKLYLWANFFSVRFRRIVNLTSINSVRCSCFSPKHILMRREINFNEFYKMRSYMTTLMRISIVLPMLIARAGLVQVPNTFWCKEQSF